MKFKKTIFGVVFFLIFTFTTIFLLKKFVMDKLIFKANIKINEVEVKNNKAQNLNSNQISYLKKRGYDTNLESEDLKKIYWVERIKDGGLILFFRHSERQKWGNTVEAFDAYELHNNINARQETWYKATCLTEKGIEESKLIGKAFLHGEIKIGKIISSPSCRAKETAMYAFGKIDDFFDGLLHYTAFHPLDRKKIGIELKKKVLEIPLYKNSNVILSSHNKVISYYNFIDKMEVDEGLQESGFYILEKINNQLIVKYKFNVIKDFITLLYRYELKK